MLNKQQAWPSRHNYLCTILNIIYMYLGIWMKEPTCCCFGSPADEVAIPFVVVTHYGRDPVQTVSSLAWKVLCCVVEFDQVAIYGCDPSPSVPSELQVLLWKLKTDFSRLTQQSFSSDHSTSRVRVCWSRSLEDQTNFKFATIQKNAFWANIRRAYKTQSFKTSSALPWEHTWWIVMETYGLFRSSSIWYQEGRRVQLFTCCNTMSTIQRETGEAGTY